MQAKMISRPHSRILQFHKEQREECPWHLNPNLSQEPHKQKCHSGQDRRHYIRIVNQACIQLLTKIKQAFIKRQMLKIVDH